LGDIVDDPVPQTLDERRGARDETGEQLGYAECKADGQSTGK
jgi:hypothetical protein